MVAEEPQVAYEQKRLGTRYSSLERMVHHFQSYGLSKQLIAEWLHVSSRQLERYIKDQSHEHAKNSVVERMALIDRLVRQGMATFEDEAKFIQWLQVPNYMLGGREPVAMLDSYFGIEEVMHLLHKMEHTLPA